MTIQPPMNISQGNIDNYCYETCAYTFKYKASTSCTVTNYGTYLQLSYDAGSSPVTFNGNDYNVNNIKIYSPSLHYFNNGTQTEGEIIITHNPISVGMPLIVCIPLSSRMGKSGEASQIITNIINETAKVELKKGDKPLDIKSLTYYDLSGIVPKSPFYYYHDVTGDNIIVYGLQDAISIDSSVLEQLKKMITEETNVEYPSVDYYYYNKYGPTVGGGSGDGEIYIDCQPTGNSEETTEVEYSKPPVNNDLGSFFNSKVLTIIIAALVFVMLIVLIHRVLVYFSWKKPVRIVAPQ